MTFQTYGLPVLSKSSVPGNILKKTTVVDVIHLSLWREDVISNTCHENLISENCIWVGKGHNSDSIIGYRGQGTFDVMRLVSGRLSMLSTGSVNCWADLSDRRPSSSARSLRIASWNVRTLYEAGKCVQATREMQRYRLDILGVSETHWIQSGQKKLRSGELVLFSGKEEGIHEEGVAIILSKRAQRTLRGWEAHGSRLLLASFSSSNRGININILQLYAPTNAASEEEKEEFYDQLQRITEKLPRKDVNIIMGDANAKVGSDNISYEEVMGKQGLGVMNDNGERFADFCSLNDLVIGGTIFPHKDIHKATWVSPDGGTENQIDHICISRKFRRSLQDVRVFRGADIGSDHHLVIATFQLKLKRYSRNPTTKRFKFQVNLLQGNKITDFGITPKNRFQPLEHLDEDMETYWSQVKDSFISTCKEVLGEKDYKHKDWISQESLNRLSERREKKAAVNNSRTRNEKEAAQRE
ncbi:hypothetical protein RRG08_036857 [Elysia crispata]|uniref:Endonuclease/exonuclease/phosphatase domain-containing protein n=1 Tax=Elysia crispata TaxID=231223 RepID=A0AAE1AWX6_9GAST|nr:hypothetical protein RRG08_036857 [Elysia crispata]